MPQQHYVATSSNPRSEESVIFSCLGPEEADNLARDKDRSPYWHSFREEVGAADLGWRDDSGWTFRIYTWRKARLAGLV